MLQALPAILQVEEGEINNLPKKATPKRCGFLIEQINEESILFANAKLCKNTIQQVFCCNLPGNEAQFF